MSVTNSRFMYMTKITKYMQHQTKIFKDLQQKCMYIYKAYVLLQKNSMHIIQKKKCYTK